MSFRFFFSSVRERERVLSRFTRDPTVGIRRDKKQSCSTYQDLRVGIGFRSFDKLREVVVSSYLSFTLCLSVFMMLELIEVVSDRLIGSKSWNRGVEFLETHVDSP